MNLSFRFFRRGCDSFGNVANFVETEQIIEHNESLTSFVQTRGSIPFFWKQSPTLAYLPKPQIYTHVDHSAPFHIHMEKLVHNYGTQVLVNLINHHKHEGILQAKFQELHQTCSLKQHVEYTAFDFHANPGQKLGILINALKPRLEQVIFNFSQINVHFVRKIERIFACCNLTRKSGHLFMGN